MRPNSNDINSTSVLLGDIVRPMPLFWVMQIGGLPIPIPPPPSTDTAQLDEFGGRMHSLMIPGPQTSHEFVVFVQSGSTGAHRFPASRRALVFAGIQPFDDNADFQLFGAIEPPSTWSTMVRLSSPRLSPARSSIVIRVCMIDSNATSLPAEIAEATTASVSTSSTAASSAVASGLSRKLSDLLALHNLAARLHVSGSKRSANDDVKAIGDLLDKSLANTQKRVRMARSLELLQMKELLTECQKLVQVICPASVLSNIDSALDWVSSRVKTLRSKVVIPFLELAVSFFSSNEQDDERSETLMRLSASVLALLNTVQDGVLDKLQPGASGELLPQQKALRKSLNERVIRYRAAVKEMTPRK